MEIIYKPQETTLQALQRMFPLTSRERIIESIKKAKTEKKLIGTYNAFLV